MGSSGARDSQGDFKFEDFRFQNRASLRDLGMGEAVVLCMAIIESCSPDKLPG